MGGWMDGWVDVKAGLRIAYSNQKCKNGLPQTWLIEDAEALPLGAVIVRTPSLLMLEETRSPFTPVGKVNFCSNTRVLKLERW